MKIGQNFKTVIVGNCAEDYVSTLFDMQKNTKGNARPDLSSKNQIPPIHLELKEGAHRKGSLYGPQFLRAIHSIQDYEEVFGKKFKGNLKGKLDFDSGILGRTYQNGVSPTRDAYYYGLVERIDNIKASELNNRYSPLEINFGDIFLVPYKFALMYYVASLANSKNKNPVEVLSSLQETSRNFLSSSDSMEAHISENKKDSSNWQSFNGNDVLEIMYDNFFSTKKRNKEKLDILKSIYPEIEDLKGIHLYGPKETRIHILSRTKDMNSFQNDRYGLEGILKSTRSHVERLIDMRRLAVQRGYSKATHPKDADLLFSSNEQNILSLEDTRTLDKLLKWE